MDPETGLFATAWRLLVADGWGTTLLEGLGMTLVLAAGAYVVGLVIGLLGALGKLYGGLILRDLLALYTTLFRSLPELVLMLVMYFAANDLLSWIVGRQTQMEPVLAGILVLGIVQGAYATEVLRGAIQAIPPGQIQAARAFGMTPMQTLVRVTLPAMITNAVPGLANLWLVVTKETALFAVVGIFELATATRQAAQTTKAFVTMFVASALLYLLLSVGSMLLFAVLERRARRGQKPLEGAAA